MSVERDAMIRSLKELVIPILRESGFKGSFPHFYRKLEEQTDLLMFQFSMWGGVLYVEISKCPPEGHTDVSGKFRTPNKMKVYYIGDGSAWHRHRIGKDVKGMFKFHKDNTDEIGKLIKNSLSEAGEWWTSYPNWWT
ncbi:DUF4304 domain-containing protein [Alkalihalobacillus sp. AL-G]|uniref:DUF4304 domain-containing protein n=1 Tax=Alkalihalobacillus sp. AL-G TaxID=2926399 RepID=UPI00272BB941|nr:DUF4304 domain-containing protein [Alkalihalobacillus sp. AL-G]WLD91722.1 DUF4304 domain-containing protein [Alkalihalobacillus sp. AL-G]